MNDNNINVFISSRMRDANSTPSNFTCLFPSGKITCKDNQGINVNVVSFDILNSMYNINDNNNVFNIVSHDMNGDDQIIQTVRIVPGSYSVTELKSFIADQQDLFSMGYSKIRNKYTFTKINRDRMVYLQVVSAGSFLGYSNGSFVEITEDEKECDNVLNMVYYNKIVLRVNDLDFEVASFENILDTGSTFDISNILLWMSKNDTAPFQMISYSNQDAGNSFCYNIYNKSVNSLNFILTNEYNEIIEDAPDWTMALQFTIYDKKDDIMVRELGIISGYLREIYVYLTFFYSFITRT